MKRCSTMVWCVPWVLVPAGCDINSWLLFYANKIIIIIAITVKWHYIWPCLPPNQVGCSLLAHVHTLFMEHHVRTLCALQQNEFSHNLGGKQISEVYGHGDIKISWCSLEIILQMNIKEDQGPVHNQWLNRALIDTLFHPGQEMSGPLLMCLPYSYRTISQINTPEFWGNPSRFVLFCLLQSHYFWFLYSILRELSSMMRSCRKNIS